MTRSDRARGRDRPARIKNRQGQGSAGPVISEAQPGQRQIQQEPEPDHARPGQDQAGQERARPGRLSLGQPGPSWTSQGQPGLVRTRAQSVIAKPGQGRARASQAQAGPAKASQGNPRPLPDLPEPEPGTNQSQARPGMTRTRLATTRIGLSQFSQGQDPVGTVKPKALPSLGQFWQ